MNLAQHIHTLEVIALLVPFVALALLVLALSFGLAWKGRLHK